VAGGDLGRPLAVHAHDRPGLARLLADDGLGAFDLVVVDGLARLAPDRAYAWITGHYPTSRPPTT
jgi:hypothetical protein